MTQPLDPSDYILVHKKTGETLEVSIFVEQANKSGWEKAYAKTIADYISYGGDKPSQLLAWLLKNRNRSTNQVIGSQRAISEGAGVSIALTKKVMKRLINKGLVRMVQNGVYMLSPKMIRNGNNGKGAMMLRLWSDESNAQKK